MPTQWGQYQLSFFGFFSNDYWRNVPDTAFYLRDALVPDDIASVGAGWHEFTRVRQCPVLAKVKPLLQNKEAVRQIAMEIDAKIEEHPRWTGGVALLGALEAELGNFDRSIELFNQVLKKVEQRNAINIPYESAQMFGEFLDGKNRVLDPAVIRLFEMSVRNYDTNEQLRFSALPKLARIYTEYGRNPEARQLLLRLQDNPLQSCSNIASRRLERRCTDCHSKERSIYDYALMSDGLTEAGYPVDGLLSLARIDASFGHIMSGSDKWVERNVDPDIWNLGIPRGRFQEAKLKAEAALTPEAVLVALQELKFAPSENENTARQSSTASFHLRLFDFQLSVRGEFDKDTVFSPMMNMLDFVSKPEGVEAQQATAAIDSRLFELTKEFPKSIEAAIAFTAFAFQREDIEEAQKRLKQLVTLRNRTSEKPLPEDIDLWIVARYAMSNDITRAEGIKLADLAVAAARQQSKSLVESAIKRERDAILAVK